MIDAIQWLYRSLFAALERITDGWLLGLAARFTFASVLLLYFLNSAATKVGSGFPGILIPQAGAYAQMLPPIAEAAGYDASKIALVPWGLVVYAGTYAEVLLPVMILLGLFTRASSLGMIGFVAVMTYVDIAFHGADAKTIGALFDRVHDAAIADQRLLWLFPLVYLVLKGPGLVSLDAILGRLTAPRQI